MVKERSPEIDIREGDAGPTCTVYLFLLCWFFLLYFLMTHFQARRSLTIFMFVVYALFLTFLLCCEKEILHPYGTDHQHDTEYSEEIDINDYKKKFVYRKAFVN